jgi:hypothetical protein
MIDTFFFIRLLNPKKMKNFQKMFIFRQIFEVWCSHHSSNLTSVESKWRHDVTWKSGCFSVPERGDISKNSGIFNSRKWDYFRPTQKHPEIESFNSRFRDELLNKELFLSIDEVRYVADRWRMDYNHYRPHSSLGYMAPVEFAAMCLKQGSGSLHLTQVKENCCEVLSRRLDQKK